MADDQITYLDAASAADKVGISVSGLRRLAPIYEEVHGPLPRGGRGSGDSPRLWSLEAVIRLNKARLMVAAGMARSVRDALLATDSSDAPSAETITALGSQGSVVEALGLVLTELRSVSEVNSALRVELQELRGQVAELRAAQSQPEALPQSEGTAEQQQAPAGQPVDLTAQGEASRPRPRLLIRTAEQIEALLSRLFGVR